MQPAHALTRIGFYPVSVSARRKYCLMIRDDRLHRNSPTTGMLTCPTFTPLVALGEPESQFGGAGR